MKISTKTMTYEELNTALYKKMHDEQAAFREQLLGTIT